MRTKLTHWLIPPALLLVLVFLAAPSAFAQVGQAGSQQGLPFVMGAGYSTFATDYGPSGTRMSAPAAWVDFYPQDMPAKLAGLGVEIEGRDLNYQAPFRLRETTGMGGVIYSYPRWYYVRPYTKFIAGLGGIDFPNVGTISHPYSHDTFLVTSLGGGAEFRALPHLWIRAEYQFQQWHHTFGPDDLTPNGVTIGAAWDLRIPRPPAKQ